MRRIPMFESIFDQCQSRSHTFLMFFFALAWTLLSAGGSQSQVASDSVQDLELPPEVLNQDMPAAEEIMRAYESYERMAETQDRRENEMFAVEGVTGMGIGMQDGDPTYFVFTEGDYDAASIPDEIDGISVTVQERGSARVLHGEPDCTPPCHADVAPSPVAMGNSARWFQEPGGCTAGFKACDRGTGRMVLVTNSHCAQFSNGCGLAPLGDVVLSPASGDTPPGSASREVGTISGHAAPICTNPANLVDATKVDSSMQQTSLTHRDIGEQTFAFDLGGPGIPFIPGELIWYSGRTSGLNIGRVLAVNVTVEVPAQGGFCCGALRMIDQVAFDPIKSRVAGGDSGSGVLLLGLPQGPPALLQQFPILQQRRRAVAGLLWGQDNVGGYFNSIANVLGALDLTLDLSQCGG